MDDDSVTSSTSTFTTAEDHGSPASSYLPSASKIFSSLNYRNFISHPATPMKKDMASSTVNAESASGLGKPALLRKIDQLRELGVGSIVPLPQLVVVGDQSSGKSSVLESLTGFSFPRAAGLCTRYATQITCSREETKSVAVSIIPRPDCDPARQEKLRNFYRHVANYERDHDFSKFFEDASYAMGIRTGDVYQDAREFVGRNGGGEFTPTTFSEDILKIEITGPDEDHLTVIDVPGIFRTATPGVTTEDDITLVNNMVKRYMKDSRTIILAVIPCNVDIATQEILKLASDADPKGIRTMGVLTKPDLVVEHATRQGVLDLVLGKRNDLALGYCIVKNRGADDQDSSLRERHVEERTFFRHPEWASIAPTGRVGIESLKQRLGELLMDISRREFPEVKAEIKRRLDEATHHLEAMGESRADSRAQRSYLTKFSTEFQRIVDAALYANYTNHSIFEKPEARLITRIVALNDVFSDVFATRGHTRLFNGDPKGAVGDGAEDDEGNLSPKIGFEIPENPFPEIQDIIAPDITYACFPPSGDSIIDHIEKVFAQNRGPELGTFGGSLLGTTFREQSKKWDSLVVAHVSNTIACVHEFITILMTTCFPDATVRRELWDTILIDELRAGYTKAMEHAQFLLKIERTGQPLTVNHYFNANLQRGRTARLQAAVGGIPNNSPDDDNGGELENKTGGVGGALMVTMEFLKKLTLSKSNAEQVREDIHDILKSYYKVSRKRFVDVVCQQVVDHYLLNGEDLNGKAISPLRVFSPDRVARMSDEQLDLIAGEDASTRRTRERYAAEVEQLNAAMKVLRG